MRIKQYVALNIWFYSQTWANIHLQIATTCLQRPPFLGHISNFYSIRLPLNNDHLSTTTTNLGYDCISKNWTLKYQFKKEIKFSLSFFLIFNEQISVTFPFSFITRFMLTNIERTFWFSDFFGGTHWNGQERKIRFIYVCKKLRVLYLHKAHSSTNLFTVFRFPFI